MSGFIGCILACSRRSRALGLGLMCYGNWTVTLQRVLLHYLEYDILKIMIAIFCHSCYLHLS